MQVFTICFHTTVDCLQRQTPLPLPILFLSVQFRSVDQLCLTLCNPRDCSTSGLPVHHQLLELAQTHVHRVSDAIQPSHPLLSPSPPAFNLSSVRVFSSESVLHIRCPSISVSASASVLPMKFSSFLIQIALYEFHCDVSVVHMMTYKCLW